MKIFKTIFTSAAFLSVTLSAFAQDYNRITLGYTPMKWTLNLKGYTATSESVDGLTLTYFHGFNIADRTPWFVEVGGGLRYNQTDEWYEFAGYKVEEEKTKFLSLIVPVNLTYRIPVTDKIFISPYGGLKFKLNMVAKAEADLVGGEEVVEDLFDEGYKHVQLGYQAGVNINYNNFVVGVGYQGDITTLLEGTRTHGLLVNVGYEF